ncbi:MAG: outer membrane lipoprotein carrier protein LolA [Erythrobacter sp.]|uniref:LolA family protein n=1 Tax=Erythrobacter sp. TaxID=1042 RepID=UPI0026347DFF|nr:outer membrane lipoprotein carrier protein LolA [Erythrobacter sp.]MDJ0978277.1 outer membrane lipoprotein carrier protein LolA [Erythrobacter sp.]
MKTLLPTIRSNLLFRPSRLVAGGLLALGAAALPTAALLNPSSPAHAQTQPGDLDRAVAALRGISTMRADFTQTDRQNNSVRGVLTLKRPGKIRFDYGSDADFLMVSNGKSLYMIDYEVGQVERWPIKNTPLGALLDPGRDVKRYGTLVETGSQDVVSVIVEDPKKPEYGAINLIFFRNERAPGGLQLVNWVAKDAQNYRTTVRLSNHRYGVSVADSTFTFRDPRRSSRRPK